MYKQNNVSLETLKFKARDLAENGEDPTEIINPYYCLKKYIKFNPELRPLLQLCTIRAHEKSKENDAAYDFAVHALIWEPAIKFFAIDGRAYCPSIPIYQWEKMNEKPRGEKDRRVLEECFLVMENLGLLWMPQRSIAIA
ncbi:MAG: hypothetical protein HYR95_02665 [Candidatus Colwellbacteria bacterium]|nr:hypothetical protein [Candidatus Colwellbacteria bacterium]